MRQRVDLQADEEWQDAEPDEESLTAVSLIDDARFTGVEAVKQAMQYDTEQYTIDLVDLVRKFGGYAHGKLS
jgi:hypothetical protein